MAGPAPEGVGLETVIEVVPGTPLTLAFEQVGVILSARPIPGPDGSVLLEYVADADAELVEDQLERYSFLRTLVTYTSEED